MHLKSTIYESTLSTAARSPSPMGKAYDTRMPFSPYCHFERKREIFFVRGQAKDVRIAASWKHRASSESEGRCFMQTALRKKTETGNEKDPSAALGSPFQGKGLAWTLPPSYGRRCPEGAEVGWGYRYPRNKAFPAWGRLRNENTAFLDTTPFPNGEGKEEAASPQKKEANPASLRSAAPSKGRG